MLISWHEDRRRWKMKKRKISVIIPCYNSSKMIGTVVQEIVETVDKRPEYNYEIVLVNDGSKDNTWEVIEQLAETNPHIVSINFTKNFGQHSALMAAFRNLSGDIVVGLDDDGEYNPHEMFTLIDELDKGYDYVCASYEKNQSKFRGLGTKLNSIMATALIDKPKDINLTSYFVMRRFVIDEIARYENPFPYIAGLLLRVTKNLGTVPLTRRKRMKGHSGYNLKKMIQLWFNGFTAFSVKPLRLATGCGVLSAFIGFVGALILIIRRLFSIDYVPGFASTIVCIVFFCGMIMIMLGIIGEYVGRIYISLNKAPQYVIRQIVQQNKSEEE